MSDAVNEAKAELKAALAARAGEPASTPEEAATQVADIRASLGRDLDALKARVPDPSDLTGPAKQIGAVAGLGTVLATVGAVIAKRRGAHKAHEEAVRTQAIALAREIARLEREPDEAFQERSSGVIAKVSVVLAALAAVAAAVVVVRQRLAGDDDVWDAPA